jgi:hypothetical protein
MGFTDGLPTDLRDDAKWRDVSVESGRSERKRPPFSARTARVSVCRSDSNLVKSERKPTRKAVHSEEESE